MTASVGTSRGRKTYSGIFGLAKIDISFRVTCRDFFSGPKCAKPSPNTDIIIISIILVLGMLAGIIFSIVFVKFVLPRIMKKESLGLPTNTLRGDDGMQLAHSTNTTQNPAYIMRTDIEVRGDEDSLQDNPIYYTTMTQERGRGANNDHCEPPVEHVYDYIRTSSSGIMEDESITV